MLLEESTLTPCPRSSEVVGFSGAVIFHYFISVVPFLLLFFLLRDVPQLVEEPPHNKCVRVSGIEVYEEDEDGNKTEPRKLQYKDFPTKKDWEIRKEEHQRDNPNHQSPSGIQRWLDHRKKYISDPQFVLHVQHLFFHDTKSL